MVLLGGVSTILGPVVGALVLTSLPHMIELPAELRVGVYGMILILVILLMPLGIVGLLPASSKGGSMLLKVENLTKRFGGLVAVSDISFGIEKGEIIGIFGPNGSGKTTLLSLLAGLLPPTAGRVLWKGSGYRGRAAERDRVARRHQDVPESAALLRAVGVRARDDRELPRASRASRITAVCAAFWRPPRARAVLRARAEKALTLCRLQEASRQACGRAVLWRGEDARRRHGHDVRAGIVAARRTGLGAGQRRDPESWRTCCATCAHMARRCASSTTRWRFSPSSPIRRSHFSKAARLPKVDRTTYWRIPAW